MDSIVIETVLVVYGCPIEIHLPLWRQHNFADRTNFRNIGSSFCRNHLRRARANLWSGQRKRQGVEV